MFHHKQYAEMQQIVRSGKTEKKKLQSKESTCIEM